MPEEEWIESQQPGERARREGGLAGAAGSELCECSQWCSPDIRVNILTGHHPACGRGQSVTDAAWILIKEMARAMEAWAADEDGIHPDAWLVYRKAKALEGVYLPEDPDDAPNVKRCDLGTSTEESN